MGKLLRISSSFLCVLLSLQLLVSVAGDQLDVKEDKNEHSINDFLVHKRQKRSWFSDIFTSIGKAITKITRPIFHKESCEQLYPSMKRNVQRINLNRKRLETLLHNIKYATHKANHSMVFYEKLYKSIEAMYQHFESIEKSKAKVIKLIDEDYFHAKVEKAREDVRRALKNLRRNEYMDPKMFEEHFHKSNEDFVRLAKELEPIKDWIGVDKDFLYHMSKHVSSKLGVVGRMLKNLWNFPETFNSVLLYTNFSKAVKDVFASPEDIS